MPRRIISAVLSLLLSGSLALPQDQATFKVQTNLVIVNVTVRDKKGKSITDLKKEDFTVFEDDKPQKVSVFELQRLNRDVLPPLESGPRTLIERNTAAPPPPPKAEPAATGSKRFQDKRLIALFFDFSSMPPADQLRAQNAAIKFLNTQMTASDMVGIMVFSTLFKVVQDFTDNRQLLIDTIKSFRIGESSDLAIAGTTADDQDDTGLDQSFVADETEFNIFNTDRKLSALEDAARKLAAFPEKKALIYFASGVGKTGMENQAQLRATVNTAVRSNVSFYPIDTRGLVALIPGGDATQASPKGTALFTGAGQTRAKTSFNDQQETLYTLAADTGGKALLDTNDLTLGMTQVQEDIDSYYILGYYSTNAALDGRYRRIKVKLAGHLEAKLDFRSGYYAGKEWKKFTATDKERQLEDALQLGDPVSDLPLALEVDYFRFGKDRYFVPISVKIPGSAIGLSKKGSNETAVLDFIGQVRDSGGKLVSSVRDAIPIKLTETAAAQIASRGLQYDTGMILKPGSYTVKFLARENLSGKMGSFDTSFTVPDLMLDSKTVRMSSVIWAGQREPVKGAVGAAGSDRKTMANHPLVQDGQKLVPSITRVFRQNQNLFVYFEVYDPVASPQTKEPSVAANLVLFHGGRKAFESAPLRVAQTAQGRSGVVAFQFQAQLAKLAPGRYTSQLNVVDEEGRKFAFARSPLIILPQQATGTAQ
jgi:VWFA-related protein